MLNAKKIKNKNSQKIMCLGEGGEGGHSQASIKVKFNWHNRKVFQEPSVPHSKLVFTKLSACAKEIIT